MSKKNQIDELQYFLKNSFFLDLEPQKALQMAKRLKKFKNNIKCDLPKVKIICPFDSIISLNFLICPMP